MNPKTILLAPTVLTLTSCTSKAQQAANQVKIVGEMKNVMKKGQLYGNINLDTIADKTYLYGLGPVEYLAGEVVIVNGKAYKSTVVSDMAKYRQRIAQKHLFWLRQHCRMDGANFARQHPEHTTTGSIPGQGDYIFSEAFYV